MTVAKPFALNTMANFDVNNISLYNFKQRLQDKISNCFKCYEKR